MKIGLLTVALIVLTASTAFPDIPGKPVGEYRGVTSNSPWSADSLAHLYRIGDWESLQAATISILESLDVTGLTVNVSKNYYVVILVGEKLNGKEGEFLQYIVHKGRLSTPFEMQLPGVDAGSSEKVFEVLLLDVDGAGFASRYSFKRKEDPLLKDIPKFIQSFDKKLFAAIGFRGGQVYAIFHQMEIPFDRGTLTVENIFTPPDTTKKAVQGSYKIENVPVRHFSFGTLVGVICSTDGDARAKVSNGILSPDPVSGVTTMALLNWHPWGFGEDVPGPFWKKEPRLFLGAAITPEFGLAGGLGLGLFKGFSLDSGGGVFLIDKRKDGEQFGNPPVNERDPFELGKLWFWFMGFGYAF